MMAGRVHRRGRLVVLLVVLGLSGACGSGGPVAGPPDDVLPLPTSSGQNGTSPPPQPTATTTRPPTPSTPSPSPTPASDAVLQRGSGGSRVLAWQQQLSAAGYWLGEPDGVFGSLTEQATYALQKAAGLRRDGRVGADTSAALARGVRPRARSTVGRGVEIDISRQLLLVVDSGVVRAVLNTSTGSGGTYVVDGSVRRAVTPRGTFSVLRQVDGLRVSPLGVLWRPKYFVGGYAVHGAPLVPPTPASHGCVRVSNPAMDWIWQTGALPIGGPVLVY